MNNKLLQKIFHRHKQILPLLLLIGYSADAIATAIRGQVLMAGEIYDYKLTGRHELAIAVLAINVVVYFFFRKYYPYALGLTLAAGCFNLLVFSALRTDYRFGLGSLRTPSFQPAAMWAGLLAYLLNFNRANRFIRSQLFPKRTTDEIVRDHQASFKEETEKFINRYQNYSNEELENMIAENKFVPAAVEAARQLLAGRRTNGMND